MGAGPSAPEPSSAPEQSSAPESSVPEPVEQDVLGQPVLLECILRFAVPSVMVRSTCTSFRAMIKQLHAHEKSITKAADAFASSSLLRWAIQSGLTLSKAQGSCIRRGDVDGCRLLHATYNMPLRKEHTRLAAEHGHVHVLQWLQENNCASDESTCYTAAQHGQLRVLQWARANDCPWDENTTSYAAKGGHLEVLQWLRVNGCPRDEMTCREAAKRGDLQMLQWLWTQGCPWDERTGMSAAFYGHFEVEEWARDNGCPWDVEKVERSRVNGATIGAGHWRVIQQQQ